MTLQELTARTAAVLLGAAVLVLTGLVLITWRWVLPSLALGTVAVLSGLVCTLLAAGFGVLAALRGVRVGLDRLGCALPGPRLLGVAR